MKKFVPVLFSCFLLTVALNSSQAYDFPFTNPYVATVIGTPSSYSIPLPENIRVRQLELTVFEDRKIPDVFWYLDKLRYSLAYQKKRAPLIFVIAGTGASYRTANMQLLQKIFYQAGFHVLSLSSPTHPDFITNASTSGVPGNIVDDSRDLYHVMELAWQQVKHRIEVSGFYLTGYSLGGAQAAFITQLDDERKLFNFEKVVMINPPVSLYNSAEILDNMLVDNIPGGMDGFDAFFRKMMGEFSELYQEMGFIDLSDDFLYTVYKNRPPKEENLAALIGIVFRLSSTNMVFTSDVMTNAGLVVPKNRVLSTSDSLTDYFKVTMRTSFIDYFNELFYPFFRSQQTNMTQQDLIEQASLKSIEDYLKANEKISLMTNEDDFILAPGELDFFRRVFQHRAKIYPTGGHCGNMGYRDNINHMLSLFEK
jgi:hypothetical protein